MGVLAWSKGTRSTTTSQNTGGRASKAVLKLQDIAQDEFNAYLFTSRLDTVLESSNTVVGIVNQHYRLFFAQERKKQSLLYAVQAAAFVQSGFVYFVLRYTVGHYIAALRSTHALLGILVVVPNFRPSVDGIAKLGVVIYLFF